MVWPRRWKKIKQDFVIGVNIGKNKTTSLENAGSDYIFCLENLYDTADFFTVNISSPNTEGLRELQEEKYLDKLLDEISSKNRELANGKNVNPKVIFLKIAPDLADKEIEQIYNLVVKYNINGIIATNTTISREGLNTETKEEGGMSGMPLKMMSNAVLKKLNELNLKNQNTKITLIGDGGIFSNQDYLDKLSSGAELIQIYTSFIYEGLNIVKKILK